MRLRFATLWITLLCASALAQERTLVGRQRVELSTSDRGRYSRALAEGAYAIEAGADGYTPAWRQIVVPAGAGVAPIDIRLTRRGSALTDGGDTSVTNPVEGPSVNKNERGRPFHVNGAPTVIRTRNAFDLANRRISTFDPYSSSEETVTVASLDALGRTVSTERQAAGGGGQVIRSAVGYDALGRVSHETDTVRSAVARQFDLLGRELAAVASDGISTETQWNAWGEVRGTIARGANGAPVSRTQNIYTMKGRLRATNEEVSPFGEARQTRYHWSGGERTTSVRMGLVPDVGTANLPPSLHRTQQTTRDSAGRVIEEIGGEAAGIGDPVTSLWSRTTYGYLGANPTIMTAHEPRPSASYATLSTLDALGRPTLVIEPGIHTTESEYDEAGNLLSFTRPGMNAESAVFDSRGLATAGTLSDGTTQRFQYDARGMLKEYRDEESRLTTFTSDALGRPTRIEYEDGTSEEVVYENITGLVIARRDRGGQWLSFVYDSGARVKEIHDGEDPATAPILLQYDYDPAGRLALVKNRDSAIEYAEYDFLGRPHLTRTYRYLGGSGFGPPSPAVIDVHTQKHEWSVYDERALWTMPVAGLIVPPDDPASPWVQTIVQTYDGGGNLESQTSPFGSVLSQSAGRSPSRLDVRRRTTESGTQIATQFGYADGLPLPADVELPGSAAAPPITGLPRWNRTFVGNSTLAGTQSSRDAARRLGTVTDFVTDRVSAWTYDDRGRLAETLLDARSLSGSSMSDELTDADFREGRDSPSLLTPQQINILGPEALAIEPSKWTATQNDVHQIGVFTRYLGSAPFTTLTFAFAAGRRTSDAVWSYAYDKQGRMLSAERTTAGIGPGKEKRRIEYEWDPNDRMVGRTAYEPDATSGWRLETRGQVLARDGLPAETTMVWDPIADRLVAIFEKGASTSSVATATAGLLRQYLHGDQGYDDPTEVRIAATPGATPRRYYPTLDAAGAGSLQATLGADGSMVERVLYADAYGDAPRYVHGPVVDKIALDVKTGTGGSLTSLSVSVHFSDEIDASTLFAGARLASVKVDTSIALALTALPEIEDKQTLVWSLSASEWNALRDAPGAESLEVLIRSELRSPAWGVAPVQQVPLWALLVHPGLDSSPSTPVIKRESLASIDALVASTGTNGNGFSTLYEMSSLYLVGSEESKTKLLTGFKAAPFVEPATGLVYFRDRWYDASTGTWLTPDAYGTIDSSNLYSYCANDPVNCSDPMGTFGVNGVGPIERYVMGRLGDKYVADPQFAADTDAVLDVSMQVINSSAFQGTMQIVGGCGEAAAGAYAVGQTGGLAAIPGWIAFAHGSDVCGAGFRTLWTGQVQESFTKQGAEAGLVAVGVDPQTAAVASTYIDLGISAYGTIGSSRALLGLGRRTAMVATGAADEPTVAALTNDELVQEIARRAQRKIGGWDSSRGSQKHAYAAELLERYQRLYGNRGMVTETSYLNHTRVPYGTPGSVRLDVFDMSANVAYDYKFVMPIFRRGMLSRRQLGMIWTQGPRGVAVAPPIYP